MCNVLKVFNECIIIIIRSHCPLIMTAYGCLDVFSKDCAVLVVWHQ